VNTLTPKRILMFLEDFCAEENLDIEDAPPQVFTYEFFENKDQNSILNFSPNLLSSEPDFWPLEIIGFLENHEENMGFFVVLIAEKEHSVGGSPLFIYVMQYDKDSNKLSAFSARTDFSLQNEDEEIFPPLDYDYGQILESH